MKIYRMNGVGSVSSEELVTLICDAWSETDQKRGINAYPRIHHDHWAAQLRVLLEKNTHTWFGNNGELQDSVASQLVNGGNLPLPWHARSDILRKIRRLVFLESIYGEYKD